MISAGGYFVMSKGSVQSCTFEKQFTQQENERQFGGKKDT